MEGVVPAVLINAWQVLLLAHDLYAIKPVSILAWDRKGLVSPAPLRIYGKLMASGRESIFFKCVTPGRSTMLQSHIQKHMGSTKQGL